MGETTFSTRTHNWPGQVHISVVDLPVFLFSAVKVFITIVVSQSTCRHVSITIVIFHSTDRPTVLSVRVCTNFVISSLKSAFISTSIGVWLYIVYDNFINAPRICVALLIS